jgi:hypothetical protein
MQTEVSTSTKLQLQQSTEQKFDIKRCQWGTQTPCGTLPHTNKRRLLPTDPPAEPSPFVSVEKLANDDEGIATLAVLLDGFECIILT